MELTAEQIVKELDKFIISQHDAKKAVAVAMRNRYRRQLVAEPLRSEITPKNILMIGPTGVGKTEIARRLAKLVNAPFIKVEATKFTEVGYVGRDVDSIIRDLVEIAIKEQREKLRLANLAAAQKLAEEKVLDILLPNSDIHYDDTSGGDSNANNTSNVNNTIIENKTRQKFQQMLKSGKLNEREIDIEVTAPKNKIEFLSNAPGLDDIAAQLQSVFEMSNTNLKKKTIKMKVQDAIDFLVNEEALKLINEEELKLSSLKFVEQNGIVFIDEIDKVANRHTNSTNNDISRSGVQRDLLPLVEGTTVTTKYGMIKTDHILFIASGAFHVAKPSDLLPELQGRFPIRVEMIALTSDDFEQILTKTNACLTEQYKALLATENCKITFNTDGIKKIAEIAFKVNEKTENIGARRLYTVMERLLEEVSFTPEKYPKVVINAKFVTDKLGKIAQSEDLARYIL